MVKIIPWADRKLSMKNWRKIWNLFPYGEICMTEIPLEWEKQNWAERIARYYVSRGRDFSVEIQDPLLCVNFVFNLLEIGVKRFYFHWIGVTEKQFISAFEQLSFIRLVRKDYKDVEFVIIYEPPLQDSCYYIEQKYVEMSVACMTELIKNDDKIRLVYRRPHPFGGLKRLAIVQQIEKFITENDLRYRCSLEYPCGCITITPNTNIYTCQFCHRKQRKKQFGDALRDKFVIGTIDKGIVREIDCDYCYLKTNGMKLKEDPMKRLKHTQLGGE